MEKAIEQSGPNCFVFRTSREDPFVQGELEQGRLRQGWGPEGTSLLDDRGEERAKDDWTQAYEEAWGESPSPRRHGILRRMLDMRKGDVVLCPNAPTTGKFTMAELSEAYRFEVAVDQDDYGHIITVKKQLVVSNWHSADSQVICELFRRTNFRSAVTEVSQEDKPRLLDAAERLRDQGDTSTSQDPDNVRKARYEDARRIAACSLMGHVATEWVFDQFEAAVGQAFERKGYERIGGNITTANSGDADHVFSLPMPGFEEMDSGSLPVLIVQVKHKQGVDCSDVEGVRQLMDWSPPEGSDWEVRHRVLFSSADSFTAECQRLAEGKGILLVCGIEAGLFML